MSETASTRRTTRRTTKNDKAPKVEAEAKVTPEEDTPKKRSPKFKRLHESVEQLYVAGSMGVSLVDEFDALVIRSNATTLADTWIDLAEKDSRVCNVLEKMTTGSAWSSVVIAHVGVIIPILMNHGILPGLIPASGEAEQGNANPTNFTDVRVTGDFNNGDTAAG